MNPDRKRLPRHYWPIVFVWLFLWGVVGIAAALQFGVNPYIGFMVGWSVPLFIEVYRLVRADY